MVKVKCFFLSTTFLLLFSLIGIIIDIYILQKNTNQYFTCVYMIREWNYYGEKTRKLRINVDNIFDKHSACNA